ncbi:thiamine pyrophosphate-binding protein [Pseudonocardia sp. KRD291]|uniref:thiamine pyrophosphate-binding protein n=1 Tax=Pseudonocardia sp. KRD291 TaxID=2792007 RepID=UPI001C4A076D|nr:thiamine pyrophosphate-binding protein [Pseudonocardia sp. KRD291]MBW0102409.1 thiamine pyrophosphate-binding protein [Pseudonocardia sp. KRD291]
MTTYANPAAPEDRQAGGAVVPAYRAIAAALADLGVDEVFGLMGDDTVRLVSALVARGVTYHNARHENAGIAMAAGYASASGRLGVSVISRGPGTTNGVTAAVNAARGNAPVLIVTGDESLRPPANTVLLPDGKALDATALATDVGVPVFTARSAATVVATVREAAQAASEGRTVLMTVPMDLFDADVPDAGPIALEPVGRTPVPARDAALAAAVAVLGGSNRPMIVAGAGAWAAGARDAIVELAERTGAMLATSLRGKDMFHGHRLDVGMIGSFSHSAGRRFFEQADSVLVFGASLNRHSTSSGTSLPPVPLVQVDADRDAIGRFHWAEVAVVGDCRLVAEQLLATLPERAARDKPWHTEVSLAPLAGHRPADDVDDAGTQWTVDPRTLLLELDELLPADRAVVTDNGNFFGFVPPHLRVPSPDRFKQSSDFAVIGLGLGTALGCALARPGVSTVAIVGDGGLLMALGELETLARLDVPLVVVVMNDCAYGAERHYLENRRFSGRTAMFPDTDFAAVAEAFGIPSVTVRSVADLRAARSALSDRDGPLLLDCKVTPTVVAPFLA